MALTFPSAAPHSIQFSADNEFYSIINRLKAQHALPSDSFLQGIPFFNVPAIPKEMQVRELFEKSCNTELCKHLLKNVVPISDCSEHSLLPQNYSSVPVMSFAQIILYKVLPCPQPNCTSYPREVATHNQYKDFEYECPFYHHDKDRRRLAIYDNADKEFVYKANYYEEGKRNGDKDKYSRNYFESMFHPLYYKMFRCKRDFCSSSSCCPFFHSETEKNAWDNTFYNFLKKDRVSYVKESKNPSSTERRPKNNKNGRNQSSEAMIAGPQGLMGKLFGGPQGHKLYLEFLKTQKNQFKAQREGSDSSFEENQTNDHFFSRLQASSSGYKNF